MRAARNSTYAIRNAEMADEHKLPPGKIDAAVFVGVLITGRDAGGVLLWLQDTCVTTAVKERESKEAACVVEAKTEMVGVTDFYSASKNVGYVTFSVNERNLKCYLG